MNFQSVNTLSETKAREEICRVGLSLFQRGYVHATAGNISMRVGDGFLITPTDACLGNLDPACLALLNRNGTQISGHKASKTIALHRQIYAASDNAPGSLPAQCVIHTHSTHCVSLSLNAQGPELLAPITPYFVMKVGHVPLIPYFRPGNPAAAHAVAQTIAQFAQQGTPIRAVMLSKLGPNVWHQDLASAMATLEELEETAKLMQLNVAQPPQALSAEHIEELRQTFGAAW
ncbi:MAG: Methylthioribulose-phosphate dehydratase [Pseudomonadota bacterium]